MSKATFDRIALADEFRRIWAYTAPYGTGIDEILEPAYWMALGAKKFGTWDRIEVYGECFEMFAEILVTASGPVAGPAGYKLVLLRSALLGRRQAPAAEPARWEVDASEELILPEPTDKLERGKEVVDETDQPPRRKRRD